eukprot:sb/3472127/
MDLLADLNKLDAEKQVAVISSVSLFLQNKIPLKISERISKPTDTIKQPIRTRYLGHVTGSVGSDPGLNEIEFLLRSRENIDLADRKLKNSLICSQQLHEILMEELRNIPVTVNKRGTLLDSSFSVRIRDGTPFVRGQFSLADGSGGVEERVCNMGIGMFHSFVQSCREVSH